MTETEAKLVLDELDGFEAQVKKRANLIAGTMTAIEEVVKRWEDLGLTRTSAVLLTLSMFDIPHKLSASDFRSDDPPKPAMRNAA